MRQIVASHNTRLSLLLLCSALLLLPGIAVKAQDDDKGGGDLRAAVQNPIGSLISLPFKFTFDNGADNGDANFLNILPVVPVTVGDWNLVNRAIIPLVDAPGGITGLPGIPGGGVDVGKRESGLGDINYSLFVSPAKPGKVIWGVGPSLMLPTASSDALGSGKWSIGPTAVFLTQPKFGSTGVLFRQLWSFAGDSDRDSVSQFLVEPFINYNLDNGWFLMVDPVMTANWKADSSNRWTVPLGGGAGRVFKIGSQAINSRLEYYYNVVRPDGAPKWSLNFTFQFLFPK